MSTGQQPAKLLAKHQPCGCIVCTCEDDLRCHGCGAKNCGTHPVGQMPNAVYEQQPAQPEVSRIFIHGICHAYESGIGRGLSGRDLAQPYNPESPDGIAYHEGWHTGRQRKAEQPAQPGSGEVRRVSLEEEAAIEASLRFSDSEYQMAFREGYVRAMTIADRRLTAAQQRVAALESDLETERARGIHTCHDQCQRPLCVAQRRIAALEAWQQRASATILELATNATKEPS